MPQPHSASICAITQLIAAPWRAQFVHTHLLAVLERSKREYARQLWREASESFQLVFAS